VTAIAGPPSLPFRPRSWSPLHRAQAQVPWQTSLAAFAFVRLLTVLPITPGGLGITELGLIATLGVWRHVPALIRTSPHNTSPAGAIDRHRPEPPTADTATG
jgi:uncharacterized membrane protein YbhN (UPF0104 family)